MNLGEQYAAYLVRLERRAVRRGDPSPMEMLDATWECRHGFLPDPGAPCGCFVYPGQQLSILGGRDVA